jgi:hypothetical protein
MLSQKPPDQLTDAKSNNNQYQLASPRNIDALFMLDVWQKLGAPPDFCCSRSLRLDWSSCMTW